MQEEQMEMQPMEGQEQQMPQVDPIAMLIEDILEKYTKAQTKLGLKCVEIAELKGEEPEMELSDYIDELQAYKESVYANLGQLMQDTEAYMNGGEMPGYDSNGFIGGPGMVYNDPYNENAGARYPENYDAGMFQEGGNINEYEQQYPQQQAYRQGGALNSMFKFKQGGKQMYQGGGDTAFMPAEQKQPATSISGKSTGSPSTKMANSGRIPGNFEGMKQKGVKVDAWETPETYAVKVAQAMDPQGYAKQRANNKTYQDALNRAKSILSTNTVINR